MDIYEAWNVDLPETLSSSYFHPIKPLEGDTPFIESLTSYISRLALAHSVTTRNLFIHELLPLFKRRYLLDKGDNNNLSSFWKDTSTLNGMNVSTMDWIEILEGLTLVCNLQSLTMLPWANVLSPKGLIRRSQAWCPFCYEAWNSSKADVYNPLIWSLEVISICPLHHTPLHQRCPYEDCKRLIPMLAPRSRSGYCSHCGRWLGRPHAETSASAATYLHFDDAEWRQWVAAQVAELIASTSQAQLSLQEDCFAEAVAEYLDEVMDNNISAAARRLQVSRRTIRDWKKGAQKPQFSSLLRFCYICGISPLHLFIENDSEAGFCSISQIISTISSQKAKKHYRAFYIERLKHALEAELQVMNILPHP